MKTPGILILPGLISLAFLFNLTPIQTLPPPPPPNNIYDRFIIGAMHNAMDPNFTRIDDLKMNLWHTYIQGKEYTTNFFVPYGWNDSTGPDQLFTPDNSYTSVPRGILNTLWSHNDKYTRSFIQRPKIEWLCFGQRSDYQCEDISGSDDLWFYSFQSPLHVGTDIPDNEYNEGKMVRYVDKTVYQGAAPPRIVVSRLKCNTEQSKPGGSSNQWMGDDQWQWWIKPRIRIPQEYANNPNLNNLPVCTVVVIGGGNTLIKCFEIKGRNFRPDEYTDYDGTYKEEYTFITLLWTDTSSQTRPGRWGDKWDWGSRGNMPEDNDPQRSKVDIVVTWAANCDMWIDYVRVDNEVAHNLFGTGQTHELYMNWLQWEADDIADQCESPLKFYIELAEFNNIPCMAYVSNKLSALTDRNVNLVHDVTCLYSMHLGWQDKTSIHNADHIIDNCLSKTGSTQIYMECYPFNSTYVETGPGITPVTYSRIPNTLNCTTGTNILALPVSPAAYDTWLQDNLDHSPFILEPGSEGEYPGDEGEPCNYTNDQPHQDEGNFTFTMKLGSQISKQADIPFIYMQQAHHWFTPYEVRREPTNEELTLLSNLAVSYGARGIVYWWYPTSINSNPCLADRGIVNFDNTPRHNNFYCQYNPNDPNTSKYNTVKNTNERMLKWGPTLLSFDFDNTNSYIFYNRDEREACLQNSYFTNIFTYKKPDPPHPQCSEPDSPEPTEIPNLYCECPEHRYLQTATFKNINQDNTLYFMFVNRRCSPYINEDNGNSRGGKRNVRVIFDQNHPDMTGYNNWTIYDIGDDRWLLTFDKTQSTLVDLGWYSPGEGRLYKMVPSFTKGGTLAGDEVISGSENFTCEDTVFSGGYNITLEDGARIHFTDSSTIVMSDSGTFTMGDAGHQGPPTTIADAAPNCHWYGFNFSNCEVKIYSSKFEGLANDSTYAVNIYDCPLVDIKSNNFILGSTLEGGVSLTYYNSGLPPNVYIGSNTFTSNSSTLPALNVMSYAGMTVPAIIESNTFTSTNSNSTAITLSGIIGGAVKSNGFSGYSKSINALSSSIDVSGNIITSAVNTSFGIEALSGSEIKMNNAGELILGGRNDISNIGNSSNNILVNNSIFLIDNGENIFNIAGNVQSYHLYGFFPDTFSGSFEATKNCFKVDNTPVQPPINDVTLGYQGLPIAFTFEPYLTGCTMGGEGEGLVINLGDGIYDTVGTRPGGGGARGEISDLRIEIAEVGSKKSEVRNMIINPKMLYDSICIQMRFRNYNYVKGKCTEIINAYPDSIYSLNAIPKLYLATSMTDTTTSGLTALKTYYENLILNHPNSTALVKRCNYYVQKCKVLLHQYTSALAGFEQIMLQNPYSYEGLVARWDHMATQLLIQGHGGGERSEVRNENDPLFHLPSTSLPTRRVVDLAKGETEWGSDNALLSDGADFYDDRSPFTREQKILITRSVNDALNTSRNADEKRYIEATRRSEQGNVEAKRELEVMRTLKEVVKPASPKNVFEHVKIVRDDMQRIFSSPATREAGNVIQLPTEYALSQNYPNPFNPMTRINYDLPKDSKVSLAIYDILGREVKRLVNNELKQAGRYTVEFNGTNLASGVYFYRIEMEDPSASSGQVFVLARKMVLVK